MPTGPWTTYPPMIDVLCVHKKVRFKEKLRKKDGRLAVNALPLWFVLLLRSTLKFKIDFLGPRSLVHSI